MSIKHQITFTRDNGTTETYELNNLVDYTLKLECDVDSLGDQVIELETKIKNITASYHGNETSLSKMAETLTVERKAYKAALKAAINANAALKQELDLLKCSNTPNESLTLVALKLWNENKAEWSVGDLASYCEIGLEEADAIVREYYHE